MTTLLKFTLAAVIVFMALGTQTKVTPSDVSVSMGPAKVSAQSPYCQGPTFDVNLCASYCAANPMYCTGYNNQYCLASPSYYCNSNAYTCQANPAACYGSSTCVTNPSICTPAYCATYPQQCQGYNYGYGTTANSAYCLQNPSICTAQFCATSPATCYTNTGAYNSTYCLQNPSVCTAQFCAASPATCYGTNAAYNSTFCASSPATCTPQFCASNPNLCGTYNQTVNLTPTVVQIQSASNTVNCGGSMSLLVLVGAGTSPALNAAVTLSATAGQVTPSSGLAANGTLTALFQAPATAGPATITANASGITGTQQITVTCGTTTTTSPSTTTTSPSVTQPPAQPVYTSPPPPPPGGNGGFRPPNTGDGGLLAVLHMED